MVRHQSCPTPGLPYKQKPSTQEFTLAAINKDSSLDTSLKAAYKSGKYGINAVFAGSGKV